MKSFRWYECVSNPNGFNDPDLGRFRLDPELYCNPATTRFIPGLTCCAPQSPEDNGIRLLLFQRGKKPLELNWRQRRRPEELGSRERIVYLINGYLDNVTDSVWIQPTARAWNRRGASVIVIDWRYGSNAFFVACSNVRTVGAVVGFTIINWRVNYPTFVILFFWYFQRPSFFIPTRRRL